MVQNLIRLYFIDMALYSITDEMYLDTYCNGSNMCQIITVELDWLEH